MQRSLFSDEIAKKVAKFHYLAGVISKLEDDVYHVKLEDEAFEKHWRFIHCSDCGVQHNGSDRSGSLKRSGENPVTYAHVNCEEAPR